MISNNPPITRAATTAVRSAEREQWSTGDGRSTRGQKSHSDGDKNVSQTERSISIAAGAGLALLALSKPISLRGLLLGSAGAACLYRGLSGQCSVYSALGINTRKGNDEPSTNRGRYFSSGIHVEQSISISKPAQELYTFWRNFENLPRIMDHLNSVSVSDDKHSHWSAKAPLGYNVEWDAQIINDEPGKTIAWQSTGEATVHNSGSVRFVERGNGTTDVRVVLDYIPPAGKLGAMVARLLGESPDVQVREDLRRFKQMTEAGEIATSNGGEPRGS